MRHRLFSTPARGLVPVVIAALLTSGLSIAQSPVAAADPVPAGPTTPSEAAAVKKARETGRPVEVDGQQTPTTTVTANPDGRFSYRSSAQPERVEKDGRWRAVDTTLTKRGDGSYAPTAAVADLTFSGGGTAALVTLAKGDKKLSLSWPTPLPAPRIEGSAATYPAVFPGVDLRMTATADSYREVLIVHDATAAKNLTTVSLDATTTSLTVSTGPDGSLNAADPTGKPVFVGSTPVMWDSRHEPDQPAPTADDPGGTTPVNVTTTAGPAGHSSVVMTPDPAALTGKDVAYPVYIDPSTGDIGTSDWGDVANYRTFKNYRDTFVRVGHCYQWSTCAGNLDWWSRGYFNFDTSALNSRNGFQAKILGATFSATDAHTGDSGCNPVQVFWTDQQFNSGTGWPGPPGPHNMDGPKNACNGGGVQANAYDIAKVAVDWNGDLVTIGLMATDEGSRDQAHWNRFANNAVLAVDFVFPPNVATNKGISNAVNCTGVPTTPDSRPTLSATSSDNNPVPLNVRLHFEVWTADIKTRVAVSPGVEIASGSTGQWQVPTDLADGLYVYHVGVDNTGGSWAPGGWSPNFTFKVRKTLPAAANMAATDYTPGYWGPAGGTFNLWTSDPEVAGYSYTFTGPGTERVPATADCNYRQTFANGGWAMAEGNLTRVTVPTGMTPGYHTIHVRTFDAAHNLSAQEPSFTFYVTPNTGLPSQQYEGETGQFTQPAGQNALVTVQSDPMWAGGKQMLLQANLVGQSFTMTFNVNTDADYTLGLGLTRAKDYGKLTFRVDNSPIGTTFDGYNPTVTSNHQTLGGIHLTTGSHQLTIIAVGANPAAVTGRYFAGVDYLRLAPAQRLEAEDTAQVAWAQPAGQNYETVVQAGDGWSSNNQKVLVGNAVNASVDLKFTAPVEADYALGAMLSKAPNYGVLSFTLDRATPLARGDTFDAYSPDMVAIFQPLGGAHLTAGQHTITIRVVGTNPASIQNRYATGVDYLFVTPLNNVTSASFADAMNNDGISDDNETVTSAKSLDLSGASLSAQTLAAAGLAPGSSITVNGATFTIPAANTKGFDNVMASGQTFPLPANQQVAATGMGMLVVSACGGTNATTAGVTYSDGTVDKQTVAPIPDWAHPASGVATPVTALPYRNILTGRDSAFKFTIYAVFIPTNPLKTLQKVTLPNVGTAFRAADYGCIDPSLHVLSVAPRPLGTDTWNGAWAAPADTAVEPPAPGFGDRTLRVIAHPSITGSQARVRLSNTGATAPVTIDAASIAAQTSGAATAAAPTVLKFAGNSGVTIPAGGEVYSDPVAFPAGGSLAVSVHLPNAPATAPVHTANGTVTYVASGNATTSSAATPFTTTLPSTYYLTGVDVTTSVPNSGTVAIVADQNTSSGALSWGDTLATQLGPDLPGGLTTVTHTTPPPPGWWTSQNQTTLAQPRLRTVIVTLGAQDILAGADPTTIENNLTALITDINGFNRYKRPDGSRIHVVLATVAPLGLDPSDPKEVNRQKVNTDIANRYASYGADEFIDLNQPLRDPARPTNINPTYLTGGIPNDAYYQRIAQTTATAVTNGIITL
jgi:hypothetical protein